LIEVTGVGSLNKKWVLWNLREAAEEIQRTIADLETEPNFTDAGLNALLREVYDHLNTAWNARDVSDEAVRAAPNEDFARWWVMPDDIIY
jgi:hypothetical protein